MRTTGLSNDPKIIAAEIHNYKLIEKQSAFEIGRRLIHVKENNLVHGQFQPWLETVGIKPRAASKYMQTAKKLSGDPQFDEMGTGMLFELVSIPDAKEFVSKEHTIPSTGSIKKVVDMTLREIREVKNATYVDAAKANVNETSKGMSESKVLNNSNDEIEILRTENEILKARISELEIIEQEYKILMSMLEKARVETFVGVRPDRAYNVENDGLVQFPKAN